MSTAPDLTAPLASQDVAEVTELAERDAPPVFARDWEAVAAPYDADAVRMPPALHGRAAIRSGLEAMPAVADFDFRMVDLQGSSPFAHVCAEWRITAAPPGAAPPWEVRPVSWARLTVRWKVAVVRPMPGILVCSAPLRSTRTQSPASLQVKREPLGGARMPMRPPPFKSIDSAGRRRKTAMPCRVHREVRDGPYENISISADGKSVELGTPEVLFTLRPGVEYEADANGQRFLVDQPVTEGGPPIVILSDRRP